MNQAIRKLSGLLVLPVLLAALLMMPLRANAAEYACDAVIPVSMELNGTHDEKFEVTIELAEKADPDTPMPAEEACAGGGSMQPAPWRRGERRVQHPLHRAGGLLLCDPADGGQHRLYDV